MPIQGSAAPEFAEVRAEFERNLTDRDEVGASVHVTVAGKTVVDLWGGVADRVTERLWDEDTLVHVWSCTKAATALCAHILAARGELDLNLETRVQRDEHGDRFAGSADEVAPDDHHGDAAGEAE